MDCIKVTEVSERPVVFMQSVELSRSKPRIIRLRQNAW